MSKYEICASQVCINYGDKCIGSRAEPELFYGKMERYFSRSELLQAGD